MQMEEKSSKLDTQDHNRNYLQQNEQLGIEAKVFRQTFSNIWNNNSSTLNSLVMYLGLFFFSIRMNVPKEQHTDSEFFYILSWRVLTQFLIAFYFFVWHFSNIAYPDKCMHIYRYHNNSIESTKY